MNTVKHALITQPLFGLFPAGLDNPLERVIRAFLILFPNEVTNA